MKKTLRKSYVVFHLTLASVVFVQSVLGIIKSLLAEPDVNWHIFTLGIVEAVAAVLFVIPLTLRFGGIALCLIYIVVLLPLNFIKFTSPIQAMMSQIHQYFVRGPKSLNTIYSGRYFYEKLKTSGISQFPCTVNNSNKTVDIILLKNCRCAKIIPTDQILYS